MDHFYATTSAGNQKPRDWGKISKIKKRLKPKKAHICKNPSFPDPFLVLKMDFRNHASLKKIIPFRTTTTWITWRDWCKKGTRRISENWWRQLRRKTTGIENGMIRRRNRRKKETTTRKRKRKSANRGQKARLENLFRALVETSVDYLIILNFSS